MLFSSELCSNQGCHALEGREPGPSFALRSSRDSLLDSEVLGRQKCGFCQRFSSSSSSWTRAGAAVKPHSHILCSSRCVLTPPRPLSLGLPHAEDHLELLSKSWEFSPSSKRTRRFPFPSSEISWMCPSMPHSVLQPLAPSLAMQSCHWSLSHQENWEFFTLDLEFLGLPHPLDAASPAGRAPTGAGAGLGSIWGEFEAFPSRKGKFWGQL